MNGSLREKKDEDADAKLLSAASSAQCCDNNEPFEEQPKPTTSNERRNSFQRPPVLPNYSQKSHVSGIPSHKLAFCKHISLKGAFRLLGLAVGAFPAAFLIAALIIASCSVGMYWLNLRDRVRGGYTPMNSMSRHETDIYREFLGTAGDPASTMVLLRAKDHGSMHRLEYLKEAVDILTYLTDNLTVAVEGENIGYRSFCGHYCDASLPISYFYKALKERVRTGKMDKAVTLTYPKSSLYAYDVPLAHLFYGVRMKAPEELDNITDIAHVELILVSFMGEVATELDENRQIAWEVDFSKFDRDFGSIQVAAFNYALGREQNSSLEMNVVGVEIVDLEMNKDSQKMAPYFATGFAAMLGFAASTLLLSSSVYDASPRFTIIIAMASSLVPILAVTTTLGVCSIVGMRINSLLLIMPFLIMGIGVNDSFLMTHAWLRAPWKTDSKHKRLGAVFEDTGPSITITTLTNVITFFIGALTPTPEIALFCFGTAIAMGFAYIFTLLLFGPILYFASSTPRSAENKSRASWKFQLDNFLNNFLNVYCHLLESEFVAFGLLLTGCVYWYFGATGVSNISSRLDTIKILPKDSRVLPSNLLVQEYMWKEYYPVTVIVNERVDIRNKNQLDLFNKMVHEYEAIPTCKGKEYTTLWLRTYDEYSHGLGDYEFDYDAPENNSDREETSETGLDYSRLNTFLGNPQFQHLAPFVRRDNTTENPVSAFAFVVVYVNTTNWDAIIDLDLRCREIAASYPQMNVSIWESQTMFVDQMLSLKFLAIQSVIWTLVCMAVVCAVFIQNPVTVVSAVLAIASISLGTVGYLSWWHLDLDPVSLAAVLMTIGMSVDFTAHVSYHYQLRSRSVIQGGKLVEIPLVTVHDRLVNTLSQVAWPMMQGGLSTVTCILPLVFLQNYIPLVFVKTISMVVTWGLFHGLVLLPAFFARLPTSWINLDCYRSLFPSRAPSQLQNQELVALTEDAVVTNA